MRESAIEKKLALGIKGLGGECFKFVSPSNVGVPDRIVILGGRVVFVEVKTDAGRLSEIQKWQIARMRKSGADVRVLYGQKGVDDFIHELQSACLPRTCDAVDN